MLPLPAPGNPVHGLSPPVTADRVVQFHAQEKGLRQGLKLQAQVTRCHDACNAFIVGTNKYIAMVDDGRDGVKQCSVCIDDSCFITTIPHGGAIVAEDKFCADSLPCNHSLHFPLSLHHWQLREIMQEHQRYRFRQSIGLVDGDELVKLFLDEGKQVSRMKAVSNL